MRPDELEPLSKACREVCAEVAGYIRGEFAGFDLSQAEHKTATSLVTHVDVEAEERLVKRLEKILPKAGLLTEEQTQDRPGDYRWGIDPLDGTTNFAHGIPCFAVSVALVDERKAPLIGVVHEVNHDEQFFAWAGGGAWLDKTQLNTTSNDKLRNTLLATGFPHDDYDQVDEFVETFKVLLMSCRALRRLGSAAVDLAYVAAGRFDGFYEHELNPWDVAAGTLLVREAGGLATDFAGTDNCIFGRSIVAANSNIHPKLLEVIQHHFNRAA